MSPGSPPSMHLLVQRLARPFLSRRPRMRRMNAGSLGVETLEARVYLASAVAAAPVAASSTIGQKMVAFLEKQQGKRLGGGECAHLATEALRVSGAKFIHSSPTDDYIWSSQMVTKVTGGKPPVYSNPSAKIQPGDIIQYTNAKFSDGKTATHHTSVVASVDSKGRVTAVYEQNVGKLVKGSSSQVRYVVKQALDLSKLISGYVKIYRPDARPVESGRYEFTIVNNTKSTASYQIKMGTTTKSYSATSSNTAGSFKTHWVKSSSRPSIIVNGKSLSLTNGYAYEIYTASTGKAAVRVLTY
jgi:hypothetical protein